MAKLWTGVTEGITDPLADDFNSSISFDSRMYREDIRGSIAHAKMLAYTGIVAPEEAQAMETGLNGILEDLGSGALEIDPAAEDIHMFIEQELTRRVGDPGRKLHTARSRNDQVALDIRLYLLNETAGIRDLIRELIRVLTDKAEQNKSTVMPGYTHMQRAQPISFGHQLLAYAMMLLRDIGRLRDAEARMAVSPIGACALAGTTYNTDRRYEAELLGLPEVTFNSIDSVSDRDFSLELLSDLSILMMHLSRFCEEIILWSSWEFRFVQLSDRFTTGSSIMPQKRNPDMAELVRGKTGRVYGDLMSLLTVMKGLPLAYNKDMQEDKEPVFDACDTVKKSLRIMAPMIETMSVNTANMLKAAGDGYINATDLADYLVRKGMSFRNAYKISGQIVARCMELGCTLEELPPEEYRAVSSAVEEDVYPAIELYACMEGRKSEGGTSVRSVEKQIRYLREVLELG